MTVFDSSSEIPFDSASVTAPSSDPQAVADDVRANLSTRASSAALLILSPVPALALLGAAEASGLSRAVALGAGVALGVIMVIAAVVLGRRQRPEPAPAAGASDPAARTFAQQLRDEHRGSILTAKAVALGLWVLCALPVIAGGLLASRSEALPFAGLCLTLAMVAGGVWLRTRTSWPERAAYLLTGDRGAVSTDPAAGLSPSQQLGAVIFWPGATAIFVAWGLIGGFDQSWIVWPAAALVFIVLFGVLQNRQKKLR